VQQHVVQVGRSSWLKGDAIIARRLRMHHLCFPRPLLHGGTFWSRQDKYQRAGKHVWQKFDLSFISHDHVRRARDKSYEIFAKGRQWLPIFLNFVIFHSLFPELPTTNSETDLFSPVPEIVFTSNFPFCSSPSIFRTPTFGRVAGAYIAFWERRGSF
jgi:hypothetical protein